MNRKVKQIADASRDKFNSMERRLSGVLRPIKPRKEFVYGVAKHIQSAPQTTFVERVTSWHVIAMILAGLVSLAVFLAVVWRALESIMGKKRTV